MLLNLVLEVIQVKEYCLFWIPSNLGYTKVLYAVSAVRPDFYTDSIDKAKFVSREWGLIELGEENESAVLLVVKMSGKSLKYIPSGWKIQKFKIVYLTFYSRGLGEPRGF